MAGDTTDQTTQSLQAYATLTQIDTYAQSFGKASSQTPADTGGGQKYTDKDRQIAALVGNRHIRIAFYNRFLAEYRAPSWAELTEDVRCALQEAASIASIAALEDTNVFVAVINPTDGQETKAIGDIQLYPSGHGSTGAKLHNTQTQDKDIRDLLARFIPNIDNADSTGASDVCPAESGSGLLAIASFTQGGGR